MHLSKVPLSRTNAFSDFFLDYIHADEKLVGLYNRYPHPDSFGDQIAEKQGSFPAHSRETLADVLISQYHDVPPKEAVVKNIESLRHDNTFTIVTGHQLNICTGPLYFIYKIVTVINACKRLRQEYPDFNFIPVYWMASEDHDYDEIKYFRLYGKKYTWVTRQQGAVGRFSTEGLSELTASLPGDASIFTTAYAKAKTLSDSVRIYVNELFGDEGLVVIDADVPQLKARLIPVMEADMLHHTTRKLVDETNALLESSGYKAQVYCRDVNFFYMEEQLRSRIERNGNSFEVLDTSIRFTEAALSEAIATAPEKFSPNVILRPLYQELILPNLAYTGGPAEVVYWLQLKRVFDHFKVPFPILLPRNFAMIVEPQVKKKLARTGLAVEDLFDSKNEIFRKWVMAHSDKDLSTDSEANTLRSIFEDLQKKAEAIDKTLGPHVAATGKLTLNRIEGIRKKMLRAEKRVQQSKLDQIESVKDQLFPNGGLQERTDNILNFYPGDPQFIQALLSNLDPFHFQFNILSY